MGGQRVEDLDEWGISHFICPMDTPGDGWRLAKATLANERVSLSSGGARRGTGAPTGDLLRLVRGTGGVSGPLGRQRLSRLSAEREVLRLMRLRSLSARLAGKAPGPEASARLAGSGPRGGLRGSSTQGPTTVATRGGLEGVDPIWHYGFLFSPALTVGGGTWAVQRDIVAERVLGLPGGPDPQRGRPWATTRG